MFESSPRWEQINKSAYTWEQDGLRGLLADPDGRHQLADVVFWGEWEAPSLIERRWPADGGLPRALHRPYWFRPGPGTPRQNTDPWVFGTCMRYSNCRQLTSPARTPSSMQSLRPGSVICFGSTVDYEFRLDTVLVVGSAEPWTPAEAAALDVDDAFQVCTAESIVASRRDARADLTLYRGATLDNPVHGMYSFVPALAVTGDDPPQFARPVIRLDGLINPACRQSTWGSLRPMSTAAVRDAWDAVRDQVLAAGLMLAVRIDTPPEQRGQAIPCASDVLCHSGARRHDSKPAC
jgi:hypothetical protein